LRRYIWILEFKNKVRFCYSHSPRRRRIVAVCSAQFATAAAAAAAAARTTVRQAIVQSTTCYIQSLSHAILHW